MLGWTSTAKEDYDYGAIKLNCTVGDSSGWFGFYSAGSPRAVLNLPALIVGYPGDKQTGTQWIAADKISQSSLRQAFYSNDTFGGMSGSGVWRDNAKVTKKLASGPYIFAVHAYGMHGTGAHAQFNHGVFLSAPVYNNYVAWKSAP